MKRKLLSTLLAIAMLLASITATVSAEVATPRYGDINEDGTISPTDALAVLRVAVGLDNLTEDKLAAADVNGDNTISPVDALLILRAAVGLDDKFPVETSTTTSEDVTSDTSADETISDAPSDDNTSGDITSSDTTSSETSGDATSSDVTSSDTVTSSEDVTSSDVNSSTTCNHHWQLKWDEVYHEAEYETRDITQEWVRVNAYSWFTDGCKVYDRQVIRPAVNYTDEDIIVVDVDEDSHQIFKEHMFRMGRFADPNNDLSDLIDEHKFVLGEWAAENRLHGGTYTVFREIVERWTEVIGTETVLVKDAYTETVFGGYECTLCHTVVDHL